MVGEIKQMSRTNAEGLERLAELVLILIEDVTTSRSTIDSDRYNTILIGLESYLSWINEEISILENVKQGAIK